MNFELKGIIPAMVTPIEGGEKVDEKALKKIINHLVGKGVHGIFALGTTGEFYAFSEEEYSKIVEITVEETNGRVPVYIGAAAITTKQAKKLSHIAQEAGADAISVLTPMFIKPNDDELYAHYRDIAKSTKLPVILYNNVGKTGVNISADLAFKLSSIENIAGIKDSSGDFSLTSEYIRRTKNSDFSVLAGRDTLIYATLCHGGSGAIAACANIVPEVCVEIYERFIIGDLQGAFYAQNKLSPLRHAFKYGTFPAVIKAGLEIIGLNMGKCFSPVQELSLEEKGIIRRIIESVMNDVHD